MSAVLLLADGRFPAGGHANSAGTESAIRYGLVSDLASLESFLDGRLATTGVVDAAFAAHACQAATDARRPRTLQQDIWTNRPPVLPEKSADRSAAGHLEDSPTCPATEFGVAELDAEFDARLASPRARAISRQMGRQLLRAAHAVWPGCPTGDHHQPVALGLAVAAAAGTPDDAAALAVHHLASAICTAAVRMLGFDPLSVAAVQARSVAALGYHHQPGVLPALTTTLTEILAEDHGTWDARLFVA